MLMVDGTSSDATEINFLSWSKFNSNLSPELVLFQC
jgi:hypothetical protein